MANFIPDMSVFAAFTLASILLAITPGPDMTLFLSRTLTQGRLSGMCSLLGASTGTVIHTILVVIGVSALLAASPTGFILLKLAGALYLLWLAVQAVKGGAALSIDKEGKSPARLLKSYFFGIGVNILNPKIIIFYITFLPQFVSADDPHAWKKMLFLGLYFAFVSLPPTFALIMVADRFANLLKSKPAVSRTMDYIFASVFAVFAIKILLTEGR